MDIQKVQKKHEKKLLKKANVVSVGMGYKIVNGKVTDEVCIIVGVNKKISASSMSTRDIIPLALDEVPTDVIEIGTIRAQGRKKKKPKAQSSTAIDPKQKFRPAPPGSSLGHKNITSGTFGCVVYRNTEPFILSNNHILANSNDALIGDDIYQPGPTDGGSSLDKIGELHDFIPIDFGVSGGGNGGGGEKPTCRIAKTVAAVTNFLAWATHSKHRVSAYRPLAGNNLVDAALATPTEEISDEIIQIGKPNGIAQAMLGTEVQKFGRTTSYTTGQVIQVNATVNVEYGPAKVATFYNQFMTGSMSAGGDSGSAILNMNNDIVGLLFAGSETVTIINPIGKVFELLGISL